MTQRPVWSEIIRRRSSWRSFDPRPLEPGERQALEGACDAPAASPFGSRVRLALILGAAEDGKRLGTYGFIQGAQAYLAGAVTRGEHDLEDYGYVFERLVLEATRIGLGTCWLGGTLDREAFGRRLELGPDEWLPAASPVGPTRAKRGFVDGAVRMFARSRKRMAFDEIFFQDDFDHPLSARAAGRWTEALEGIRLGPSASNKQPWRCVVDASGAHLYLQPTPGYGGILKFEIQRLDMGIAMCHLELGARELGLAGAWHQAEPSIPAPEGARYVGSWLLDARA
jgi:nitroreductase